MIHPDTELRRVSEEIGFGVFASARIPRGTIVWVLDALDRQLSRQDVESLGRRYADILERYSYLNARGARVLCWDLARLINHSCDANVLSSGWEFDIAVRDIEAGEEVTNDYGCLNLEGSFACRCAAANCRGRVSPADFDRLADEWDARVHAAFPDLACVPQPLWDWLSRQREVRAAMFDPSRLPSIRRHRLPTARTAPLRKTGGVP